MNKEREIIENLHTVKGIFFGRTNEEKEREKIEKLKSFKSSLWFAWRPVRIDDGRYAWMTWLKKDYNIKGIVYSTITKYSRLAGIDKIEIPNNDPFDLQKEEAERKRKIEEQRKKKKGT